jgi:uncharacterized peroxidase-related enzyme
MTAEYQLSLTPKTLENADSEQKAILEQAKAQLGFVPNMYAGMVNSPGLLKTYLSGYEQFRQNTGFSPIEQEVIFLTISRENGCSYCMAAHSVIADTASKVPAEVTAALREGRDIPDPQLAALSTFTRTLVAQRGKPSVAAVDAFLSAGYTETQVLEIILAIAVKTLSNYSNHLLHTPVDEAFAGRTWQS